MRVSHGAHIGKTSQLSFAYNKCKMRESNLKNWRQFPSKDPERLSLKIYVMIGSIAFALLIKIKIHASNRSNSSTQYVNGCD